MKSAPSNFSRCNVLCKIKKKSNLGPKMPNLEILKQKLVLKQKLEKDIVIIDTSTP